MAVGKEIGDDCTKKVEAAYIGSRRPQLEEY
jgi:hypothetical protein